MKGLKDLHCQESYEILCEIQRQHPTLYVEAEWELNKEPSDRYVIIDINNSDFMKDENGDIAVYSSYSVALNVCGIYEFPDAWICKLDHNYKEQ